MKYILSVIALLSIFACQHKATPEPVPANSRKVAVKLIDSLGMLTIYIPDRYDTGFVWLHESDTETCDEMKCRFQYSGNTIFKESGFVWREEPYDSVDQVTISYQPYGNQYSSRSIKDLCEDNYLHEKYESMLTKILIDTCLTVSNRQVAAVGSMYI